MTQIHPSAILPVVITWLVILGLFGLTFYFAFFAPPPESEGEEDTSTAGEIRR
jgi:hypothetical protein